MPFTPFHMGPGLALKAVFGRYVSLMLFGFSQVTLDLEPLVRIIRGDAVLHGFTHTYLGATLVAMMSVLVGRPACQLLLRHWTADLYFAVPTSLRGPRLISWPAAIAGAFVGTYSHVFLDSIMHADMQPLAPLSNTNALLHVISVGSLHLVCVLGGVVGGLALLAAFLRRRSAHIDRQA
jgi:hypothetical protein